MGFFSPENKSKKKEKIELQNIVMGTNEDKLQVSDEFLDKITKIYISKRMSAANSIIELLPKIKQIGMLYQKFDSAMEYIEQLIIIEPYYIFKEPRPTAYKAILEQSLDKYVEALIAREWHSMQSKIAHGDEQCKFEFKDFYNGFTPYIDRVNPITKQKLDEMFYSVFPEENPDANVSEDADAADTSAAEGEFIPAEFEQFTSEDLAPKE